LGFQGWGTLEQLVGLDESAEDEGASENQQGGGEYLECGHGSFLQTAA
jgi:hypothetical protein